MRFLNPKWILAASFLLTSIASAATLTLHDGSVIRGNIRSLQNDVYTIETDVLGTVQVRKQDIRSIDLSDESRSSNAAPAAPRAPAPGQADIEAMQQRLLQTPDLFSLIQSLQNDPEIQAVMSDPEVMNAVASGDIATLMNHPKVIELSRNPKMRAVIDQVQ